MNSQFFLFLDASRWIAALLVVVSHTRHLVLIDYTKTEHSSLFVKAIYFATGFGHEAVVIFFVISGFLVGGITLERWRRDGVALREYAVARVARIYTVFLPALFVSMVLDFAGAMWFDGSQLYSLPEKYHTISLAGAITDQLSVETLLGNLVMLQNIVVPVLGSNGPLWSLAYEWWYYWIFVVAAILVVQPSPKRILWSIAALAVLAWWLPANLILMGTLWLIGMALYFIVRTGKRIAHPALGILIFLAAMTWSRLSHNVENVEHPESIFIALGRDVVVAVGFSILACSIAAGSSKPKFLRLHKAMANFSYSTYLVHFPMMVFVVALLKQEFGTAFVRQPSAAALWYWAGLTAILYSYAYLFAALTERYTDRMRTWLRAHLPYAGRPS